MSGADPKGWGDRFLSFCFAVLGGMVALFIAVAVLQSIWGWLVGVVGVVALVQLGIVVYRATQGRW